MGRLEGKVALVSGAARGQGRSHAVRLAQEGADILAFDVCGPLASVVYPLAAPEDLKETVRQVEGIGRRIIARPADVRDGAAVRALVDEGVGEFGRLDVVSANAGICTFSENAWTLEDDAWEEMIAINLSGAWRTVKAAVPSMIAAGRGGSIVITGSTAGAKGMAGLAHYAAAKHGLVGLMRTLAIELAPHSIRVNVVHPGAVDTPMVVNDVMAEFLADPDVVARMSHLLPVQLMEPADISHAVAWLASDEARYVTGASPPVDAGFLQK